MPHDSTILADASRLRIRDKTAKDDMGYLFKALMVIGLIYLISPFRAPLPDWLAHPRGMETMGGLAMGGATTIKNMAAPASKAVAEAALTVCKGREKSCLGLAATALSTNAAAPDAAPSLDSLIEGALASPPEAVKPDPLPADGAPVFTGPVPLPPRRDAASLVTGKI